MSVSSEPTRLKAHVVTYSVSGHGGMWNYCWYGFDDDDDVVVVSKHVNAKKHDAWPGPGTREYM